MTLTVPGPCSGVPGVPANFVASKSGNRITLFWDLPVSGPAPTGFTVMVAGAFVGSFPVGGRTISGTVAPGSYTISVAAANACGSSAPTMTRTVEIP